MTLPVGPPLDTRLLDAFEKYLKDCLPVFQRAADRGFLPNVAKRNVVVSTGSASLQITEAPIPNWRNIMANESSVLHSLGSFRHLLDVLVGNHAALRYVKSVHWRNDGRPLTPDQIERFFSGSTVPGFLASYLDGQTQARFDGGRFLAVYISLEELLLTDAHTERSLGILLSFQGPDSTVNIDEAICIRRASDEDLSELLNRTRYRHEELGLARGRWLIEVERKVPNGTGASGPGASTYVETIIRALRLAKPGGAYCTLLYTARKFDSSASSFAHMPPSHVGTQSNFRAAEDIVEFLRLYRALSGLDAATSISFAIRRFNFAYERVRIEDRFVDLMIVLESLLVEDGKAGEIAYKFRMRLAALLASAASLAEKREHREIAKAAYDMRSAIVHGDTKKQTDILRRIRDLGVSGMGDLTARIEGYARRTILLALDHPDAVRPRALDDRLLGGI